MSSKARNLSSFISDPAIDASEIGSSAVTTDKIADLNVTHEKLHTNMDLSSKTVTFADNHISGNKIHGGVISDFASIGIDDNASATALRILSNGTVGINTATTQGMLDVHAIGEGGITALHLNKNSNTGYFIMAEYDGSVAQNRTYTLDPPSTDDANAPFTWSTGNAHAWKVDGTEYLRIAENGKIGIGATSPQTSLTISRNVDTNSSLDESAPYVSFQNTSSSYTAGNIIGGLTWFNSSGGHASGMRAAILAKYSNTATTIGNVGTTLEFKTASQNAGDSNTRMTIDSIGNVGIGTTSPAQTLDVGGAINSQAASNSQTYGVMTFARRVQSSASGGVIATLTGSFGVDTMCTAVIHWTGLYAYSGSGRGHGITQATTRRSINNTAWADIDNDIVHEYNTAGTSTPNFYWDNGVLRVSTAANNEVMCSVTLTYRQCTVTPNPGTGAVYA